MVTGAPKPPSIVTPAKAGAQATGRDGAVGLGSRFRGNDEKER